MKYGLQTNFKAKLDKGTELAEILLTASKIMSSLSGCYLYIVSTDQANSDSVWVTEVWDSQKTHDDSLKLPDVQDLISKAIPLLASMPEGGLKLDVLGGHGITL